MLAIGLILTVATAQPALTRDQVIADTMQPYTGRTFSGVDRRTLTGKIMTGYQGWFATPNDGSGMGWFHWGGAKFDRTQCYVDMWPETNELEPDEKVPTAFRHSDGKVANVFSSYNKKTVLRHFRWMKDYGIDGAFVQRYGVRIQKPVDLRFTNTVLNSCREGANVNGRTYAIMYDLTSLPAGGTQHIIADWKLLIDRMRITNDQAYLRDKNKPVVAVWGIGFREASRRYSLQECLNLVNFLKNDPRYGGNRVVIGVPTYWRTLTQDATRDPKLIEIARAADIIAPWTVGRFKTDLEVETYSRNTLTADLAWCRQYGKEMLPLAYPGFSWSNRKPASPFDQIPRRRGDFIWTQFVEAKRAGAKMMYQAMFDEVDEGTAIFKVSRNPPTERRFLNLEGEPSDAYLWLVGQASRMFKGQVTVQDDRPRR